MRRLAIALLLGTAIPALGQQAAPQFVARVNGVAITQSAFDRALRGVLALGMRDSPELRATVRDQVIARELFRQEAEKSEIQTDPELRAAEEEARTNAMLQSWLRSAIKPRRVTEAEVRRRYDAVVASLGEREYKARLIQVSSEAVARALAAQLKANAASFESLARQFSTAPSAVSGGALEWLSFKVPLHDGRTQGVPLPIAAAMTRLQPGMVTGDPVEASGFWYLVKLDAVRPAVVPDYGAAKGPLRQMLEARELEQATAALVASLMKGAKIE